MDFEQPGEGAPLRPPHPHARPQPEHRIALTLAVVDPQALWAAAAAKLLCAPGMTLDDVLDVVGPREDPAIVACLAMLTKPVALPGCVMDDFWVDSLRGCPPRIEIAGAVLEYKLAAVDTTRRRAPATRRSAAHQALRLLPPAQDDAHPR